MHLLIFEFLNKNIIDIIIDRQQEPKIILAKKPHPNKEQNC